MNEILSKYIEQNKMNELFVESFHEWTIKNKDLLETYLKFDENLKLEFLPPKLLEKSFVEEEDKEENIEEKSKYKIDNYDHYSTILLFRVIMDYDVEAEKEEDEEYFQGIYSIEFSLDGLKLKEELTIKVMS